MEKLVWTVWVYSAGDESDGGDAGGVFAAEESDERVSFGQETVFARVMLAEERTCCCLSLEMLKEGKNKKKVFVF